VLSAGAEVLVDEGGDGEESAVGAVVLVAHVRRLQGCVVGTAGVVTTTGGATSAVVVATTG
jgi:hypothetical protein